MLSFILASILLSLFFAVLILFPYKKVAQWLKKYIHIRTFFTGIVLIVFSFIVDVKQGQVPSTNEMSGILLQYAGGIHQIIIAVGVICFVASFFINHFFNDSE